MGDGRTEEEVGRKLRRRGLRKRKKERGLIIITTRRKRERERERESTRHSLSQSAKGGATLRAHSRQKQGVRIIFPASSFQSVV